MRSIKVNEEGKDEQTTEDERTPAVVTELLHRILDHNFPRWKQESEGSIKWNLADDRLEVHHKEKEHMEDIHCEETYKRDDPRLKSLVELQRVLLDDSTEKMLKNQSIEESYPYLKIHTGKRVEIEKRGVAFITVLKSGETSANEVPEDVIDHPELWKTQEEVNKLAKSQAQKSSHPPSDPEKPLEESTAEIAREGEILITSKHIATEKEAILVHDFIVTEEGRKNEYNIKKLENGVYEEKTKKENKTPNYFLILLAIATVVIIVLLAIPFIFDGTFKWVKNNLNITGITQIATIIVLAWTRVAIQQEKWKRARTDYVRREAGIPKYPGAKMDTKPVRRELAHMHDYFNFKQDFTNRRRNNATAVEEASRKDKEHDHVAVTMRKQEDANAVAFLKKYYAKHESQEPTMTE